MKLNSLIPLIALLTLTSFTSAHAQVSKSGGLFGFKKKGEQLSSDLFPDEEVSQEEQALQQATNISADTDKKKKSGIFPFGKKEDDTAGRPPISPTPVESREPMANEDVTLQATPQFEVKDDKKRGGGFHLFKKDKEDTTQELQSIASNPIYNSPEMAVEEVENQPAPEQVEAVQPAPQSTEQKVDPNAPVPDFVGVSEPQKEEEGGIFSRFSMPKMPKRKTDYVEVETVMKDGEFVNQDEETTFTTAPTLPATGGESKGPEIINGVKVYSSWDEVEANSVSEAERIISNIR